MVAACFILAVVLAWPEPKYLYQRCPELKVSKKSGRAISRTRVESVLSGWLKKIGLGRRESKSPEHLLDAAAALDLFRACLHAGLPPVTAVQAVAAGSAGTVAAVFGSVGNRLVLGTGQPWREFLVDSGLADVAAAAERSQASGTVLAGALAELAADNRGKAGDAAEAVAERAGVLIAGPLALCFLPAFVVLGLIPTVVGLADTMFAGAVPW